MGLAPIRMDTIIPFPTANYTPFRLSYDPVPTSYQPVSNSIRLLLDRFPTGILDME